MEGRAASVTAFIGSRRAGAAMATWEQLVEHVQKEYKIDQQKEDMLRLLFNTGEGRSQVVYLWKATLLDGAEEWVQIESPFGRADTVDLRKALEEIGNMTVGGAAI